MSKKETNAVGEFTDLKDILSLYYAESLYKS